MAEGSLDRGPSSTSCRNSAEDLCESGRPGRFDQKIRAEKCRNRHSGDGL